VTTGAVYALIALGLTLIYGVLHIINFAHGAALMVALYAVYLLKAHLGIDPYLALPIVVPGMFGLGYALQRGIINRAGHGKDEYILLVTLGISIVLENLALLVFKSDTRTIETPYTLTTVAIGPAMIALPKLVAFAGALATSAVLLLILTRTDLGRAIRAVAKEKLTNVTPVLGAEENCRRSVSVSRPVSDPARGAHGVLVIERPDGLPRFRFHRDQTLIRSDEVHDIIHHQRSSLRLLGLGCGSRARFVLPGLD